MLTTFLVDSQGSGDFLTIQEAVNAAGLNSEDDVIQIAPGTYFENITIGQQQEELELIGLSGIGPNGESGVIIDAQLDGNHALAITPNFGSRVRIENLLVTGGLDGIRVAGAVAPNPHRVEIHNVTSVGNTYSGLAGVYAGDISVTDSHFFENGHNGIYLWQSLSLSADNVVSEFNIRDGIYAGQTSTIQVQNSQLSGNDSEGLFTSDAARVQVTNTTITDNKDNGIDVRRVGSVTVADSDVLRSGPLPGFGNVAGFYSGGSSSVTVTGSTFHDNSAMGIGIFNTLGAVTFEDSSANRNGYAGLVVGNAGLAIADQAGSSAVVLNATTEGNDYRGMNFEYVGSTTVSESTIDANGTTQTSSSLAGGGIRFVGPGSLNVSTTSITNNTVVGEGGGLFALGDADLGPANVTLNQVTVGGNTAEGWGGGISLNNASLTVENSTISRNSTQNAGGGIFAQLSSLDLANVTVSGNQAVGNGGGLSTRTGSNRFGIVNSTIVNNTAGVSTTAVSALGGGIHADGGAVLLLNTLVAGNTAANSNTDSYEPSNLSSPLNSIFSLGNNLSDDAADGTILSAVGDIVGQDPSLGPLQNNGGFTETHALLAGSPALDAGAPNADNPAPNLIPPTHDQRGFNRVGQLDIGAFENQPPTAVEDFASTNEDTPVVIDVLSNDIELDGEVLTIERIVNVENGEVTQNEDGTVTFTPAVDFFGEASFWYIAEDSVGNQSRTSVVIDVVPVNDAPVISPQSFSIDENSAAGTVVGEVTATDVDSTELVFSIESGNELGGFSISDSGLLEVADSSVLDFEETSVFELTVAVTDGQATSTATITVNLNDVDEVLAVEIDIDPNDASNTINLRKDKRVDVVLFSSFEFDATLVDIDSLRFGATGTEDSLSRKGRQQSPRIRFEDINGDGQLDLIATFDVANTGLTTDDTEAILTGRLLDGTDFMARQTIVATNSGGGRGKGRK
ncbi:MAG: pectinesterase family protein [Planctomycetaceae bacterium]|nr:pectinesterase family protein [Planctomycetaceae bacterium]